MIDARTLALASWAVFFSWCWTTGETTRYLGPRTAWVVPFGAITLGVAALASVFLVRRNEDPSARRVAGALVLVAPLLVLIAVPSPSLGSLAAGRKSALAAPVLGPQAFDSSDLGLRELAYAAAYPDYAPRLGIADGLEVDLVGFVHHEPDSAGTFLLTRFYVSCCAADALPYSVPVMGADQTDDEWLRVRGHMVVSADGLIVEADSIEPIPEPDDPYLS